MIFFRLREFLKGEHVEKFYNQLLNNETFTKEQIKNWQRQKLLDFLLYLSKNNPFYSKYISENSINLSNFDQDVYKILALFPVTDKQFIKQYQKEWLSSHLSYDNLQLASTSGSSGIPFKFYQTPLAADYKTASKYRLYKRFGIGLSDKQLCYGTGYNSDVKSRLQRLKIDLNNKYVNNRYFVDVSSLSKSMFKQEIDRINRLPIRSIWGYPSTIFEIAKYSLTNNYPINNKKLKAVIYSGESHNDYMDEIIKKAFNVITIDEYNSIECFIAGSCKVGKLHLNEDTTIFEVLHSDGNISDFGDGELLITSLFSKNFPFIRYKNGDVVSISKDSCSCGNNYKVLKNVDGRSSCFIFNGDIKVPHAVCTHYLPHSEYRNMVDKFQIEQNERNSVIVRIVLKDKKSDCSGLERMYRSLFNNITVKFLYVDDIPNEKLGKFKDVINNVKE